MRIAIVLTSLGTLVAPVPASAQDLPKRKSGLWEIRTSSATGKSAVAQSATVQMCIDENTDDVVQQQMGAARQSCSRHDVKRTGEQMVVDSVCRFGETTATTHSVFTGAFDTAYKVESRTAYDPPLQGTREGTAVMQARWLGACKAGQKPGDMILGNGMKINLNDHAGPPARK